MYLQSLGPISNTTKHVKISITTQFLFDESDNNMLMLMLIEYLLISANYLGHYETVLLTRIFS